MNIERLEVGQMNANCFLVSDKNGETAIIDPGDDTDYIISKIQRNDLHPRLILATHGHVDHVMSVLELKIAFNIPFYMHKLDVFLLKRMASSAMHFLDFDPGPPADVDIFIEGGNKINVGDIELETIFTPGHTPGSVCFYSRKTKDIFVGDLMFNNGSIGRTDFAYSDKTKLVKSIRHITELPKNVRLHSGHGESFTLEDFPSFR